VLSNPAWAEVRNRYLPSGARILVHAAPKSIRDFGELISLLWKIDVEPSYKIDRLAAKRLILGSLLNISAHASRIALWKTLRLESLLRNSF
jgi:hypothetical protein